MVAAVASRADRLPDDPIAAAAYTRKAIVDYENACAPTSLAIQHTNDEQERVQRWGLFRTISMSRSAIASMSW